MIPASAVEVAADIPAVAVADIPAADTAAEVAADIPEVAVAVVAGNFDYPYKTLSFQ